MRAALILFPLLLAAAPSQPPATMAAFEQSVAATKTAMMGDPEKALASAIAAVALSRRLPPSHQATVAVVTAEWLHGEALLFTNRLGEAEPLINKTLTAAQRIAPNTKLHGDLLRSRGAVAAAQGRYLKALRDYQQAHDVFRAARVPRSQAMTLQDLGFIHAEAGDPDRALGYFDQSADVFTGDTTLNMAMHNNRAEILRKQKRYGDAATAYRSALVEARKLGSPLLQVRILTNLAGDLADEHLLTQAQAAVEQAMALVRHGEAAGWQPFAYGIAARIAFEQGDLPRARMLIGRSFAGADLRHTEMLYRDVHAVAARIFEKAGDERLALAHLKAFQRLDSEAQELTASAASQLTSARFDFANQNAKISNLKQSQLESAVQLERQRARLTTLALGALALIAALLGVGFASLRRSRNETRAANAVLSQVNDRLEGALKAKTDFLATTSHEIRTPLNGILGMTQILLRRKLDTETREQIEVVHGAGETMRALVDDILDVAKMETGELQVTTEPTRARAILEETERLWRGQAQGKGLHLSLDMAAVPDLIRCDPMRLRQLVFNLVSNAIKFTPTGSVAIRARGDAGAGTLVIEVADSGIGIPADQLDLIFDPFHQVDGGTTRQFGGTGLGLAICKKIAAALDGDIAVRSEVGYGTTFTLRLPLIVEEAPVTPVEATAPRTDGLLLVEGNPLTQGVLSNLLEPHFAQLRCIDDGDAALAAIDRGTERQLLIEAKSAVMAGVEPVDALRMLVERGHARGMHVTVLLAPSEDLPIEAVLAIGAEQLVLKPVSGSQLLRQLSCVASSDVAQAA